MIDLRSDTVTRFNVGMRQAMAAAAVGDDVYWEGPSVKSLGQRVAELLGHEVMPQVVPRPFWPAFAGPPGSVARSDAEPVVLAGAGGGQDEGCRGNGNTEARDHKTTREVVAGSPAAVAS